MEKGGTRGGGCVKGGLVWARMFILPQPQPNNPQLHPPAYVVHTHLTAYAVWREGQDGLERAVEVWVLGCLGRGMTGGTNGGV